MANPSTTHAARSRTDAHQQAEDEVSVTEQAPESEAHTLAPEPGTAAGELSGIVQAAGGDSVLAIGLALIAVVGGGAAFKLYTKLADQRHEREMAKLQAPSGGSDSQGAHAASCDAERQQLGTRVSSLENELKTLKRGLPDFPEDVDLEALEIRLRKAERAIKRISVTDN